MSNWANGRDVRILEGPQATRARRRRRSGTVAVGNRQRLRMMYFVLASMWGFTIGTAAAFTALSAVGGSVRFDPLVLAMLFGATIIAVLGGFVTAAAYEGMRERMR